MQRLFEGEINTGWFPLVDATDFASIESGIAASSVKVSLFGILKGSSAVMSLVANGTGSLAASNRDFYNPKSGLVAVRIGTAELSDVQNAFYDRYLLWASVTGAALVLMEFEGEYKDTSDIYSLVSDMNSTMGSQFVVYTSDISQLQSVADDIDSQLLLTASKVTNIEGSQFDVISNYLSNASNYLSNASNYLSNISLIVSDVQSALDSQFLIYQSDISQLQSVTDDIDSQLLLNASMISDVASTLDSDIIVRASQFSDVMSNIDAVTASVSASDISDIASAVWGFKYDTNSVASSFGSAFEAMYSGVSDIDSQLVITASQVLLTLSLASDIDSQVLLNASMISDVASTLDSDIIVRASQFSDVMSNIDAVTASVSASDISDIASAVWGEKWRVHSLASTFGSAFSALWTLATTVEGSQFDVLSNYLSNASNYLSNISAAVSDVESQLDLNASMISDVASTLDSDVIVRLSQFSDVMSNIDAVTASVSASDISDIASAVWGFKYDTNSVASSFGSVFEVMASNISDVQSAIDSQALLGDSRFSDVMSNIDAVTASVSASDISDIASAVQAIQASRLSDILSAAVQGNSRALVVQSMVSDVDSQLLLNASMISDVASTLDSDIIVRASQFSDVMSNIDAVTASVSASDISDIASAVQVIQASRLSDILSAAQQGSSRVLVVQSRVSDVESQLDVTHSLVSDIDSQVLLNASMTSDAASAAQQAASRTLVVQSMVSDVESQLDLTASVVSDIDSQLTITASQVVLVRSNVSDVESQLDVTHSLVSDIDSQVLLNASVLSDVQSVLSQLDSALSGVKESSKTIVSGAAEAGTLSVTQMTTDLTEATDDHYIGRAVIWKTGVLADQAASITDYRGSDGMLTFAALTESASAGDTFVIV